MTRLDQPWREIARAARLRDWSIIDAIVEDRRTTGDLAVRRGIIDARRELGLEPLPSPLAAPDPVLISDLPSREGIEIDPYSYKWRRKGEADTSKQPRKRRRAA